MSYNQYGPIHSNGQEFDRYAIQVNVMGCSQVDTKWIDYAYDGLKQAHDEIYNETKIPGTRLKKYTTDFTANSCDESTERADANEWLDNNGFGNYNHCLFLFVTNCDGMARTWGHAFNERCVGFVNNSDYNDEREHSVMAIHESLHAWIAEGCEYVEQLAGDHWTHVEHRLGHIGGYYGSDEATPLCASYASSNSGYASSGDCDNYEDINWGQWTRELSSCTKSALDYTYDHWN